MKDRKIAEVKPNIMSWELYSELQGCKITENIFMHCKLLRKSSRTRNNVGSAFITLRKVGTYLPTYLFRAVLCTVQ